MKTKLYLLTGFLGSGKTTFLKHVLSENKSKKIGIIMNEFGKVGIDGGLINDHANELIEINRGSIFCTCLKLSFVQSLKEMSEKDIDILFVEGSGLADPSNIGEILGATEMLIGEHYEYAGCICVVDAVNFIEQSRDMEALSRQVKHSHLAAISKTDLTEDFTDVVAILKATNPSIQIEVTKHGQLPFNLLTDWKKEIEIIEDETSNTEENKPKTLSMQLFEPVFKSDFEAFIDVLKNDAYRMKGYVDFKGEGIQQVDVVSGKIDYKPTNETTCEMVIISKIGPQIIKPIMTNWQSIVKTKFKLKN